MAAPALSATLVTYRPEPELLGRALASLAASALRAREEGLLGELSVFVVDNGPDAGREVVRRAMAAWPASSGKLELIAGQGNVGYGRANNLVLGRTARDFHLVMNPDVELDREALAAGLRVMATRPDAGLLAPDARGEDGERQYLSKRYPSPWVLFLRGFAPRALRKHNANALARYEMRDVVDRGEIAPVLLASGCFMLMRSSLFERLRGFDPRYFLYFEDYDLSLRMGREAAVLFVPSMRIVHHGGEAARKGLRHVTWFIDSAWRFFATQRAR